MENEIQTTNENAIATRPGSIPIDRATVDQLKEQRQILTEYVASQLRDKSDYGIIPGTTKPCLYKPGAEKLRTLFNLTITLNREYREVDRDGNYAEFCYKATVFKNDIVLAECEGSCNSGEKKYKTRKEWIYDEQAKKKVPRVIDTPVCDILNTLQKMAQKRAFVGAVILAVGASDFFNQDFDDIKDAMNLGIIPDDKSTENNAPKVKTVSDKPEINHNDLFWIEAKTSYEERDLPKQAGFKWEAKSKKWLKEINQHSFDSGFPFEVVRL